MATKTTVKNLNTVVLIYDEVAGAYSAPITLQNDASAVRYFDTKCQSDPYSKDYKLYKLGSFDPDSGKLVVLEQLELLSRGDKHVKKA